MALTRATDKIIANADGNLNLSGIVTASSFQGDGSGLTGVVQSDTPLGNSTASTIFYEADNATTISTTTTLSRASSNPATVDFYADGFKIRGTGSMINGNTVEYVYMAWAEQSSNTPFASEPNAR